MLSLTVLKRSRSMNSTRETVVGISRPAGDCALQAVHEQRPVRQLREMIVKGVVEQPLLGAAKAGAHVVERHGQRRGFRAAAKRHLRAPSPRRRCHVRPPRSSRSGWLVLRLNTNPASSVHRKMIEPAPTNCASGRRETAGWASTSASESADPASSALDPRQRKRPRHIAFTAERHRPDDGANGCGASGLGQPALERLPLARLKAARAEVRAQHEIHFAMRRPSELFGDGVVERVGNREVPSTSSANRAGSAMNRYSRSLHRHDVDRPDQPEPPRQSSPEARAAPRAVAGQPGRGHPRATSRRSRYRTARGAGVGIDRPSRSRWRRRHQPAVGHVRAKHRQLGNETGQGGGGFGAAVEQTGEGGAGGREVFGGARHRSVGTARIVANSTAPSASATSRLIPAATRASMRRCQGIVAGRRRRGHQCVLWWLRTE